MEREWDTVKGRERFPVSEYEDKIEINSVYESELKIMHQMEPHSHQ